MFHLITGGSGSGKSVLAETVICQAYQKLIENEPHIEMYYIATMIPYGKETEMKIQKHRQMRMDKGFTTIECYMNLASVLSELNVSHRQSCVILECMSNLVANELFEEKGAGKDTVASVMEGIRALRNACSHLVVVTNEVFSEPISDTVEMQEYKRILGTINCQMAAEADNVTEVIYGIPVDVKGVMDMQKDEKLSLNTTLKLIIGGEHQGKKEFAESKYGKIKWVDGENCSMDEIYNCQGIFHFEAYIRRMMQVGNDMEQLVADIVHNNPGLIILSQEIGCGLVPIDAFERKYREQTGRICTELTQYAVEVYRVVCGIGVLLKGEQNI